MTELKKKEDEKEEKENAKQKRKEARDEKLANAPKKRYGMTRTVVNVKGKQYNLTYIRITSISGIMFVIMKDKYTMQQKYKRCLVFVSCLSK